MLDWRYLMELRNTLKLSFFDSNEVEWDQHVRFMTNALHDPTQRLWAIYHNGNCVGMISLSNITEAEAELGRFMVDPMYQGTGVAIAAELLALRHAFDFLRLQRVYTRTKTSNVLVVRLHQRFGFSMWSHDEKVTEQQMCVEWFRKVEPAMEEVAACL